MRGARERCSCVNSYAKGRELAIIISCAGAVMSQVPGGVEPDADKSPILVLRELICEAEERAASVSRVAADLIADMEAGFDTGEDIDMEALQVRACDVCVRMVCALSIGAVLVRGGAVLGPACMREDQHAYKS